MYDIEGNYTNKINNKTYKALEHKEKETKKGKKESEKEISKI